ncbi:MAG: site-2 protease family protein, partial [Alphaproteobacteria bacterium]
PATNFALALAAGLAAHVVEPWQSSLGADGTAFAYRAFGLFILANLVLGLFNLFPMPPLDGGRIAVGMLPRTPALALARIEPYGLLLVMFGLFILPHLLPGYDPMGWFFRGVVAPGFDFVLMLTGHG